MAQFSKGQNIIAPRDLEQQAIEAGDLLIIHAVFDDPVNPRYRVYVTTGPGAWKTVSESDIT